MATALKLLLIAMLAAGFALSAGEQRPAPKEKGKRGAAQATFTGCLDQRGPDFVLADETELKPLATLHGEGASDENWFARYLGHRVRIEGRRADENGATVIRVRRIESIADTCEPR